MSDFYPAFSSTCFVVLGLWLTTVVGRHAAWRDHPDMVWRAFGVGLFFSLPGIMTLISLVDPTSPRLWEWSYTITALGGALVVVGLYNWPRDPVTTVAYPIAIGLYVAIGAIAIVGMNHHVAHMENRADQVLLCVVLFAGVNVAWWLIFADKLREPDRSGPIDPTMADHPAAAAEKIGDRSQGRP
jgi:hypothetical protein